LKLINNHNDQTHLSVLSDLLDNTDEIVMCVAFLKVSGLKNISEILKTKLGKCTFFIGTDFYLTEPNALRILFLQGHSLFITKQTGKTFHPKMFYFKTGNSIKLLTGSANITSGGLENNFEASLLIETTVKSTVDNDFSLLIDTFKKYSEKITSERRIENYEKNYLNYNAKHSQANIDFQAEKIPEEADDKTESENKIKRTSAAKKENVVVSQKDYDEFPIFFPQYIIYKRDVRKSGVVNKETDQKDLLKWYQRIKKLIKHEVLPDELASQLIEVDFPFGNGWGATIIMMWDKRFKELVAYKNDKQKHLDFTYVPGTKNQKSIYYSLGGWCAQQKLRRNKKKTPLWTDYEEEKMQSLNYLWDAPNLGGVDDELWYSNLLQLENYYSHKKNYHSVPPQDTDLGGWLNEQMTSKNTGSRNKNKEKTFLHPTREHLLGELLKKNNVEWKWQKQLEREGILEVINWWKELTEWKKNLGDRKPTEGESKKYSYIRERINSMRFRSKSWTKEKDKWKLELVIKHSFPLSKRNDKILNEQNG
jgi:HKD family nuclease